jgi:hypothetical protein
MMPETVGWQAICAETLLVGFALANVIAEGILSLDASGDRGECPPSFRMAEADPAVAAS